jgi:hypothetical protein
MTKNRLWPLVIAFFLAGCGGGSNSTPATQAAPAASPTPMSAAASQSVSSSGGTISVTVGSTTAAVTVPPGAVSGSAMVSVTYYGASALPRPFQQAGRRTLGVPAGATVLGAFAVTDGGVPLVKPLQLSIFGVTAPAGSSILISGSSSASAPFVDVDTTTAAGGGFTDAFNPAYTGPTLAGSGTLYVFYAIPSASAGAPPAIAATVSGPASVTAGQTATYTDAEQNSGGFPYLTAAPITWSVDNPALGTINATTGILSASSAQNVSGNVVATDSVTKSVGKAAVAVLSGRPATVGDSLSYTGTVSTVITNYAIATPAPTGSSSPAPVVLTQAGTVTETVSVAATPSPNVFTVNSDEIDTLQLSTLETKTTTSLAYQANGSTTNVRQLSTTATDSNGATFATAYTPTSGLIAVLPEVAGTFGPNDPSKTTTETDPGVGTAAGVTDTRVTNSDGSYVDTQNNTDGSQNVATAAANFSGVYQYIGGIIQVTISPPTTGANPYIPVAFQVYNFSTNSYGPAQTSQEYVWYPAGATQLYTESDTVATGAAFDTRCSSLPAKYGSTGNLTTQAVTSIDPLFGTLDTITTQTYDVPGVGTVCAIFSDNQSTFLDYTGQEGYALYSDASSTPLSTRSDAEVLTLASASVAGQPLSTQSAGQRGSAQSSPVLLSRAAVSVARARFEHAIRLDRIRRQAVAAARFRQSFGGVK